MKLTRRSFLSLGAIALPAAAARMRNSVIESGGGVPGMNILEVYTDEGITGRSSAERMR